jgi:hypothetical protein
MDDRLKRSIACAQQKRLPDFFIVGQAKSGTTALYEMLRHHPQIYMPDVKEPWFFARDQKSQAFNATPETFDDYLSLFEAAKPEQRIGEASVSYLWSRTAASRIADVQPDARIIAILREPVDFLHSLHLQLMQMHIETEKDLRKAISLESARRQGSDIPDSPWPQLLLYSDHTRYVEQLRRYHDLFPPEHVLVLIYDDFRRDNKATVRRVLRFLDVDDMSPIDVKEANPSVRVRSQYVNRLLYAVTMGQGLVPRAIKASVKACAPRKVRHRALETTYRHVVYGEPQPPDELLVDELRHRFRPEVVSLSEYLGCDLVSMWGYNNIE